MENESNYCVIDRIAKNRTYKYEDFKSAHARAEHLVKFYNIDSDGFFVGYIYEEKNRTFIINIFETEKSDGN